MQAMLSNLYVVRTKSDGTEINRQKVPVSWASKKKFIDRIDQGGVDETKVAMKLPRIAVEMVGMNRREDKAKKRMDTHLRNDTGGVSNKFFTTQPYMFNFQAIIATKSEDDMHQIMEQILPYFGPTYTMVIKPFSEYPDHKENIPVTLTSISPEDNYEGSLEDRTSFFMYLDFEVEAEYSGPISTSGLIKKAIINFHDMDSDNTLMQRITVTPDPITADSDTGEYITTYFIPGEGDSDSA